MLPVRHRGRGPWSQQAQSRSGVAGSELSPPYCSASAEVLGSLRANGGRWGGGGGQAWSQISLSPDQNVLGLLWVVGTCVWGVRSCFLPSYFRNTGV